MHTTALVRIEFRPGTPASPAALRSLFRIARRLRSFPGLRRWQTFRDMDASGALQILLDWDSAEPLQRALRLPGLQPPEPGAEWGFRIHPPELLRPTFDRRIACGPAAATLLRVGRGGAPGEKRPERDSDFALRALASPGTTRLYGARSRDGALGVCRIDFDTEDGLWHFLDSPLRRSWTSAALGEEETWSINLPRLQYERGEAALLPQPRITSSSLSIDLAIGEDRVSARLRFHGRIDPRGASNCDRVCRALVAGGCRRLEVDVSGLASISRRAVEMLTGLARDLKEAGGEFILIDNAERVKRVTRSRHLQTSLL